MFKEFWEQIEEDEVSTEYEAGFVGIKEDYGYMITREQYGAEETFSVGQPVYDEDGNLMGYLGIGLFNYLEYALDETEKNRGIERVPCYFWTICLATEHCKEGKRVYTFWQNRKVVEREWRIKGH